MATKKYDYFMFIFITIFIIVGAFSVKYTIDAITIDNIPNTSSTKALTIDKESYRKLVNPPAKEKPTVTVDGFGKADPFSKIQ